MKILVITQYFYPETFRINTLCQELVDRGHEVTVLTGYPQYPYGKIYDGYGFNKSYDKNWNGVKVERIKMLPRGKTPIGLLLNCISFVKEGNKWVKKCTEKFDVVHVFEVSPVTVGLPAVKYKEKFGTPMFFNMQDLWPENVEIIMGVKNKMVIGMINKIVDKIYNASNKILCTSNGFVDNIHNRGISKDKLVFWPQFCDKPDDLKMVKPTMLNNDTFNVVFTGNIGQAQGLEFLINAMKNIENENVNCYLVGDGRALSDLNQLVAKLDIQDKVHFVGRVTEHEANEYASFADVAFMSLVDNKIMDMTIPAKLQTYLACKTPVLAAVSGECADIIRDNNLGICVKKNADDVSQAIMKIMTMPKEDLNEMSKNCDEYFDKNFEKTLVVDKLETFFYQACGGMDENIRN